MFIAYSLPDEKSTVRLIEYFEIMLAFGVEKIVIYEYEFHPTIADVSFLHNWGIWKMALLYFRY